MKNRSKISRAKAPALALTAISSFEAMPGDGDTVEFGGDKIDDVGIGFEFMLGGEDIVTLGDVVTVMLNMSTMYIVTVGPGILMPDGDFTDV